MYEFIHMNVKGHEISVHELIDDTDWRLELVCEDCLSCIGYIDCSFESDRLHIFDFKVYTEVPKPWPIVESLRQFLGFAASRENFRGFGLGSYLLDCLLAKADTNAVCEIWGEVTQGDIDATSHLLELYQSRGFSQVSPDEHCMDGTAVKVVRSLQESDNIC